MAEESESVSRKSDHWVDAIAAVVLIGVFVVGMFIWLSSQ